jgi:hypothetical protein
VDDSFVPFFLRLIQAASQISISIAAIEINSILPHAGVRSDVFAGVDDSDPGHSSDNRTMSIRRNSNSWLDVEYRILTESDTKAVHLVQVFSGLVTGRILGDILSSKVRL